MLKNVDFDHFFGLWIAKYMLRIFYKKIFFWASNFLKNLNFEFWSFSTWFCRLFYIFQLDSIIKWRIITGLGRFGAKIGVSKIFDFFFGNKKKNIWVEVDYPLVERVAHLKG